MCHEIFYIHFFHDANPSGPLLNRLKYFRIRLRFLSKYFIRMFEHSDSAVWMPPRSQNCTMTSSFFILYCKSIHPWQMCSVCSLIKRFLPDCSFKRNRRPAKFFIQTPRSAFWLRGRNVTMEFDSVMSFPLWNF